MKEKMNMKKIFLTLAAAVVLSSVAFADDGGAYNTETQTEANGTEEQKSELASEEQKRAAFAKESFTVREFSEAEIGSKRGVKIVDSLDEETQRALVSACYKLKNKVVLDLSECGFGTDEAKIDFFHIRNVRSCVLPKATKSVVNFDCADLEEVVLNDGLEEIAAQAFFESGLKSVRIPPSVKYVGACAFGDCPALKFIRTDKTADSGSWSAAWSAWNEAKIISGGDYEETESGREENPNKIEFDHKVYHLVGGKMNMKIRLASSLQKTQKAKLHFYDAHNGNSEQGCLEVKVKKRKAEIEVKNFDASQIGIADTDLFRAIFDECGDYWVKVECVLVLADGTRIPLDGSARLYFAGMPGM